MQSISFFCNYFLKRFKNIVTKECKFNYNYIYIYMKFIIILYMNMKYNLSFQFWPVSMIRAGV